MDRSLDEIIGERPREGRKAPTGPRSRDAPPRGPRREDYPRDGVRKVPSSSLHVIAADWVHDRFQDDSHDRDRRRAPPPDVDRYEPAGRGADSYSTTGARLRVDNVHYDLTEDDIRSLFVLKGPVASVKLLYDRMDRSQGTAFIIYVNPRDARDAMAEFDGQNANGLPIKITMQPTAPAASKESASLFDRMDARPPRSLFDRIDGGGSARRDDSREDSRRRRARSDSPPRKSRAAAPEHIDRYVPSGPRSRDSRSPVRRRGTPREGGRRPGARREESGRGGGGRGAGGRGGRTDEEGRPLIGGRPRKTAEELDAEMEDYWGKPGGEGGKSNGKVEATGTNGGGGAAAAAVGQAEDTDMVL
ncbi:hypothetical protein LTR08_006834 [Meristemomyces frigidus]|nr:hypothetical protein LTR08_006834 [Meristemomyces frigidus]